MDISGDGGIIKKIIKEGHGEDLPLQGAEVFVHYVGKLLDGTVFDSSRDRGEKFSFKLGQGSVIKGWDQGVATMKKGEICLLTCEPEYAYGKAGSPPKIPANATLEFEIELFEWDNFTKVSDGIKKQILVTGEGYAKPENGSPVTFTFEAALADGTQLSSMSDPVSVVLSDDGSISENLEECIKSMKKGEKAIFVVVSEVKGANGLDVSENSQIHYTVHLQEFTKGKQKWEMSSEEKVDAAIEEKEKGNVFFKQGNLSRAMKKYEGALEYIRFERNFTPELQVKVDDLKLSCNSNMSAVALKQKNFSEVIKLTKEVLDVSPENVKALYRRASAYSVMGDPDNAMEAIQKVLSIEPENKTALILKKKVLAQVKAFRAREKAAFGGIFS